jgi:hypothetical protein
MRSVSGDFWARIIMRMLPMHIIPIMLLLNAEIIARSPFPLNA